MRKLELMDDEFKIIDGFIDLDSKKNLYTYGKWITNGEIALNRNVINVISAAELHPLPKTSGLCLEKYFEKEKLQKVLDNNNFVEFGEISYNGSRLATNESGTIKELIGSQYADAIEGFDCFYYAPENCFYIFYPFDDDEGEMLIGCVMKMEESTKDKIKILRHLEIRLKELLNNF